LKIISWNLLHTGGAGIEQVEALIVHHRPDVILMQEATARIDRLPHTAGGHYARIALPGRQHGLAAWTRQPLQRPAIGLPLQRGVIVRRLAQILGLREFTVVNVHLSHGQLLNRFQLRQIAHAVPGPTAILGDCNLIGSPYLRGFDDVGPRHPTHRSVNLVPLRLDRCFVRGLRCHASAVLADAGSDHQPILVELAAL
jgi:endonuclease/exonuclease/phosphatase (EEP) superfamily protein YafD